VPFKYFSTLSLSAFIHSSLLAANFDIPTLSNYLWKGQDAVDGQPCFVTMRSDNKGLINYLAYEGSFSGSAEVLPQGLSVSQRGLIGIVNVMRDLPADTFSYVSPDATTPGLILRSLPLDDQGQFREVVLAGPSLVYLESAVIHIQDLGLSLDASCTQLIRQRLD
jgi:hypothetical protein